MYYQFPVTCCYVKFFQIRYEHWTPVVLDVGEKRSWCHTPRLHEYYLHFNRYTISLKPLCGNNQPLYFFLHNFISFLFCITVVLVETYIL